MRVQFQSQIIQIDMKQNENKNFSTTIKKFTNVGYHRLLNLMSFFLFDLLIL
jgi:hypothetical protein